MSPCAASSTSCHPSGLNVSAGDEGLVSDNVLAFAVPGSGSAECGWHVFYNTAVNTETLRGHNVGSDVQRKTLYSNGC